MKKNLLEIDLQLFADEVEDAGENEVAETAEPQEDETSEDESVESSEETTGVAEPQQSAEENARYAAIRRRAEEEARRRYEGEMGAMNQQIAAMCQGITHPVTGQPITNVKDYVDALSAQQRLAREQELKDKGIDPAVIDRMIAENPIVMQAQQVIENHRSLEADAALQNDLAEIARIDPSIKGMEDLASLPNFQEMLAYVAKGNTIAEAYKMCNFDTFMQHQNEAARQQAINQMRGKSHLPSQSTNVASDNDDVEVPADIMANWRAEGKTEKQIKELYKTVAKKLHLN